MLYLVERDREGVETLTQIKSGMKLDKEQPEVYKAMHKVMMAGAKTIATRLIQTGALLRQHYTDLCETTNPAVDAILADKLRGAMYGCKFRYLRSRNSEEDVAMRRQVMQFGINSGRRDGFYVEFAYIFTPKEQAQ